MKRLTETRKDLPEYSATSKQAPDHLRDDQQGYTTGKLSARNRVLDTPKKTQVYKARIRFKIHVRGVFFRMG